MPYPTGSDLAAALANAGVQVSDPGALDARMAMAAKMFEGDAGFIPFLAAASPSARTFGMHGGNVLYLNSGIATLTGVVISIDGSALTASSDYWVRKPADGLPNWPYTKIQFGYELDTNPDVISITARWGFETDLSAIPKDAIIKKGMADFLRDFENEIQSSAGSPSSIKQGEVDIEFTTVNQGQGLYDGSLQKQCGAIYNRAVAAYQAPWKLMP